MATLMTLPNELILQILQYVGIKNFREDISRLSVCSNWYNLTKHLLLETLLIYPRNLPLFMAQLGGDPTSCALLEQLAINTRDVRISLFNSLTSSQHAQSVFLPPDRNFQFPEEAEIDDTANGMIKPQKREEVTRFIQSVLPRLEHLSAFRLRISDRAEASERLYQPLLDALDSLSMSLPRTLVTLELSFDSLAFARRAGRSYFERLNCHFCPVIAKFLPLVKILSIHLECTCPELLNLSSNEDEIGLERLVINMDPRADSPRHTIGHWNGCGSSVNRRFYSLQKSAMVDAGKTLARRMKHPKVVRMLFGMGPSNTKLLAVDCITGQESVLPEGAMATDDGDVLQREGDPIKSSYEMYWDR